MRIFVKVKPNAKAERVSRLDENHFSISVKESPKEGRANTAVVRALAAELGVAPSHIALVSGAASREKAFEVN